MRGNRPEKPQDVGAPVVRKSHSSDTRHSKVQYRSDSAKSHFSQQNSSLSMLPPDAGKRDPI